MKKRLRHTKNKQPRPPERAARRDYVHELEFELPSYREVNECYRQALVRAETTIHLKEEQKNMWWRHLQAERGQSCALRVTIRELQNKNARLQDEVLNARTFMDLAFMEALVDVDGYSTAVH